MFRSSAMGHVFDVLFRSCLGTTWNDTQLCVATESDCPARPQCSNGTPYRCSDNSCAATPQVGWICASAPLICPILLELRLDVGAGRCFFLCFPFMRRMRKNRSLCALDRSLFARRICELMRVFVGMPGLGGIALCLRRDPQTLLERHVQWRHV